MPTQNLEAAIAPFLRSWASLSEPFTRKLEQQGSEEKLVDLVIGEKGFVEMFRMTSVQTLAAPRFQFLIGCFL